MITIVCFSSNTQLNYWSACSFRMTLLGQNQIHKLKRRKFPVYNFPIGEILSALSSTISEKRQLIHINFTSDDCKICAKVVIIAQKVFSTRKDFC